MEKKNQEGAKWIVGNFKDGDVWLSLVLKWVEMKIKFLSKKGNKLFCRPLLKDQNDSWKKCASCKPTCVGGLETIQNHRMPTAMKPVTLLILFSILPSIIGDCIICV